MSAKSDAPAGEHIPAHPHAGRFQLALLALGLVWAAGLVTRRDLLLPARASA